MATTARGMSEPIRVSLRVRPFDKLEEKSGCNIAVKFVEKTTVSISDPVVGDFQTELDCLLDPGCDQEDVYQGVCANVPQHLLDGVDCAVLTFGAKGTGKTFSIIGGDRIGRDNGDQSSQAEDGVVSRLARGIFDSMMSSAPDIEYTVRCSVVEIYLDRIRDLLVDSCHVRLVEGKLRGCSRLSCISADDIINIVYRGHAARTRSAIDSNRESSRSSMIVQVEIEQYDSRWQNAKTSTLLLCDLVGSELSSHQPADNASGYGDSTANCISGVTMVSKSLNILKRLVEERKNGMPVTMPLSAPSLAQLLAPYFGGQSYTSILLTGSISDTTSKETVETAKFGEICRSIRNTPTPNVHERWQDFSIRLVEARENNKRLEDLVQVLANECHKLQSKSGARLSSTTLENVISEITQATSENREIKFSIETKAEHQIRTEQMKLRSEARRAVQTRDEVLSSVAQMQADLRILKDQNIRLVEEKVSADTELVRLKNEVLVAQDQKNEAEHMLRTSQFRENEAVAFLRQFRRFYFRLRKKMAVDGSGNISQIAKQIPGAPGLDNLVDIDQRMFESGLLEHHEIGEDNYLHSKTSPDAVARSSIAATKMSANTKDVGISAQSVEILNNIIPIAKSVITREHPRIIEARQRLNCTPAGKYLEMRENDLEAELLSLSEKASQLEKDLAEEKEKVEALTKNTGVAAALERLKNMKETKVVRDRLEQKEHDLNAVIWKMNEMHVTGKSIQEMLSERESRIVYLENTLNEAKSQNSSLLLEKDQNDRNIHGKIASLLVQIRRFSGPIRYFGDPSDANTPLQCRLVSPFALTTDSTAKINSLRRASIGEAGEWIRATYSALKTDVHTQTSISKTDRQTQTEIKVAKDNEAQTDRRINDQDVLVDAASQTDDLVEPKINERLDLIDAVTQTDGVLLTLYDIELSTIEAATSSVPEANVDDLLFIVDNSHNSQSQSTQKHYSTKGLQKSAASRQDPLPKHSLSADAFLFMEDNLEDNNHATVYPAKHVYVSDRDIVEKDSSATLASTSLQHSSVASSMQSSQTIENSPTGNLISASHFHRSSTSSMASSSSLHVEGEDEDEIRSTGILAKRHSGEGLKTFEKSGTLEPPSNLETNTSAKVNPEETKPSKPISSFLARLQAQTRKKDAKQANETPNEDCVPEFMKKFRTIGARNANESVIETAGESTALFGESLKQPNNAGTRFVDTSSSTPWQPRKKKSEDDSESSESSSPAAEQNINSKYDNGVLAETEVSSRSAKEWGIEKSSTLSVILKADYTQEDVGEIHVTTQASKMDDSDSHCDDKREGEKLLATQPLSKSKAHDDSKFNRGRDEAENKPLPLAPSSKADGDGERTKSAVSKQEVSSFNADDDSDSNSDDEEENESVAPPRKSEASSSFAHDDADSISDEYRAAIALLIPARKSEASSREVDDDSVSSSGDDDEIGGKSVAQARRPDDSISKVEDGSDSHSDDDEVEIKQIAPAPKSVVSSLKADDDCDSSVDEAEEERKPGGSAALPVAVSKANDDSDSSSDEEEVEYKPTAIEMISTSGRSKVNNDSSDEDWDANKALVAVSNTNDDRSSSSDEDGAEIKSVFSATKPGALSSADDNGSDSSSDDDDEKTSLATLERAASLPKEESENYSSSDEDEVETQPVAPRPTSDVSSSSNTDDDSESSSDEDGVETQPAAPAPKPAASSSKADDYSDSSSGDGTTDDGEEEKKSIASRSIQAEGPSKVDDDSDSSSDNEQEVSKPVGSRGKAIFIDGGNYSCDDGDIKNKSVAPASKEPDTSEEIISHNSFEQSGENSKKMLQGGKSTDFKPKRKVTDFGAELSPALAPKKTVTTTRKSDKNTKSNAETNGKLAKKAGTKGKGSASDELSKSSAKFMSGKKSSKFAVRGTAIVLDDGEWGKNASKKAPKEKSTFVIKNGKLVKNEISSPPPPKSEKPAFKIIGGKLVKQGKGDGETRKKGII